MTVHDKSGFPLNATATSTTTTTTASGTPQQSGTANSGSGSAPPKARFDLGFKKSQFYIEKIRLGTSEVFSFY